jgi:hypothetical protein
MTRTPSPAPEPDSPSRKSQGSVDAQHASINQMLARLEETTSLPEVAHQLGDLRALLQEHFETEAGDEGLHQLVTEFAPRHIPHVQKLLDEHEHLLADLQGIQDAIHDILDCRTQQICADVRAFADKLKEHEKKEDKIFDDALYGETGGHQ